MKILPHNNSLNFNANCRGQYEDLKRISMANGTDISKIDKFEKTIQKMFPYNNQSLKFNILGTPASFNDVAIQLLDKEDKVIQQIEGRVLPRNIGCFSHEEAIEEKAKVFEKVVSLIRRLKKSYSTQLKNEQERIEHDMKFKKTVAESTPTTNDICKCVVSHDIERIKNISVTAGYPLKKAEKICASIKEKFSDDKYNYRIFYLKFEEDDNSSVRKYVIYHGLTNNLDFNSKNYRNIADISKTVISSGVTKEDRYKLLENVYNVININY